MRKWVFAGLLLFGFTHSKAQSFNLADKGCATVTTPQQMQKLATYLSTNTPVKAKTTSGPDSIPLSIHIVAKDDGTGRYSLDNLLDVLCELNTHYAPVGFYFFVKWPVTYINNTSFYDHDYISGSQMMVQNNVANTVNVYFVDNPNGACGYYMPFTDGLAIGKNCAAPGSTTLTHEIGHYFSLPHTFHGWENGQTPAFPEKVTRGAGANCNFAGDLFCDTDADYLGDRWSCPYTGNKTDVNGDLYHPDSSLYMSYATDNCMSRFSPQQTGAMQSNLILDRNWLMNTHPTGSAILDTVTFTNTSGLMYANNKTIRWNKVKGAEAYYVKLTLAVTPFVRQDTITADTFFNINMPLSEVFPYAVTVAPLSSVNLCRTQAKKTVFSYKNIINSIVNTTASEGILSIAPNPANNAVTVKISMSGTSDGNLQVFSISGQKVFEQQVPATNNFQTTIATQELPNGLYLMRFTSDKGTHTEKLVVQH